MSDSRDNNSLGSINSFTKGMIKDTIDALKSPESYTHARNAATNLADGIQGGISTEPSNSLCYTFPYEPIGFINLSGDDWVVFLTDDVHSEIGIFHDNRCSYESLTKGNQPCLNFNRKSLITGAARRGFDCGFDVYWSDGGRNPDRFLNTAKVPFIQDCTYINDCLTCVDTNVIDCAKLRLAPEFRIPCLKLSKSQGGGTLVSGSYQVTMAYTINGIRVTDYVALSNVQGIFDHGGSAGALKLEITGAEDHVFTEMEIVIISESNSQLQVKRLGTYSSRQGVIYIDDIDQTLPPVDILLLPLSTPAIESCDAIFSINNYLLRVGSREKPEPNYQPYANQVVVKWAQIEYPEDYYHKGGGDTNGVSYPMNVGYMSGEVYAYFIRGVYTSGDKTALYHIPGRTANSAPTRIIGGPAVPGSLGTYAHGLMGGYESTELYPDDQPLVWGSLCGEHIRHHRFPDQNDYPDISHYSHPYTNSTGGTTNNIRVMGVFFENIQPFRDNNGNIIEDIQGYEILRASREGHQSILAKGQINSMRSFTDPISNKPGLYQNYPYNDLTPDLFLTSDVNIVKTGSTNSHNTDFPLTGYRNDILSFHSPDTVFQYPYLGKGQLQLLQVSKGFATGNFQQVYKHGKFKTITDLSSILGITVTAAIVMVDVVAQINSFLGGNVPELTMSATEDVPFNFPLYADTAYTTVFAGTDLAAITSRPAAAAINLIVFTLLEPIKFKVLLDQLLTIITSLAPAREFAWQWNSAGRYNDFYTIPGNTLYDITDYQYIKNYVQTFAGASVNNLYRNNYVALQLQRAIPNLVFTFPFVGEKSRWTIYERNNATFPYFFQGPAFWKPEDNDSFSPSYTDYIQSFYAAYKVPQPSQYGQLGSTKNIPIGCMQIMSGEDTIYTSEVMFGGDTYINRYTEKNPFFFFNDWLLDAPVDYMYNYRNYINVPYPRYWIDNTKIHTDFLGLASKLRHLDAQTDGGNLQLINFLPAANTYVKNGAFYLFCNGVRDFFVESGVNVGYRDWEDEIAKQFWNPYGFQDASLMFRSDIIKSDILYKYDYSLSAGKFYNQYLSWGQVLRRDYDPLLAYTCFSYYPRRMYYSLPQEEELIRDNWRSFLPDNYKDFPSRPVVVKSINKTGALIFLENDAPVQFTGIETMSSNSGTEYTTGNGNLFQQALQSITNADGSLEYGSCQNRLAVVNTPHGVFWISRESSKVFQYSGEGIKEISTVGMRWWFSRYMKSFLLQQYPDYALPDNPVIGVGMQITYDSINDVLYFCKKDYQVRKPAPGQLQFVPSYSSSIGFYRVIFGAIVPISLTNTQYFTDTSWTISYDPKTGQWVSMHDWFPNLSIAGNNHFLTTKEAAIWRHNIVSNSFCNYYGIQFPWELQWYENSEMTETTLQSVEWFLESYKYRPNSTDKFQVYNKNFDQIMVFNEEQNSGLQKMVLQPLNDPYSRFNYPFFDNQGYRNIQYSNIENRTRVNDFYDYTLDRGQSTLAQTPMFLTDDNGYTFSPNFSYFDTLKSPLQLKRLRYTGTNIFMRMTNPGDISCTMRYSVSRNQFSPR